MHGGFAQDGRGSMAIFGALVVTASIWFAALAVDLGSLYLAKRQAQAAVDLAAIAAARDIPHAEQEARAALAANHIETISGLEVVAGSYVPSAGMAPASRFTPNDAPANAVRIRLTTETPLYLAASMLGKDKIPIRASAIATSTQQAAFSIGSALARLDGGIANALLGRLLGTTISLSLMDYRALLDANVKLFDTLESLAGEAHITAATYGDVAGATVSLGQMLSAAAIVASRSGQGTAASVLTRLAASATGGATVPVGRIFDLGPYAAIRLDRPTAGFDPSVNLGQLLAASGAVANGTNQVALDLGASVPGLANLHLDIAIGEPMQQSAWYAVGERGTTTRTAQTRLRLVASVGGAGVLAGVAIRVPLYLELAYAEGRLAEIHCGGDVRREGRVDVAARPGVAELWLGEIDPSQLRTFTRRPTLRAAELVRTPLLQVTGSAHAAATNAGETSLSFTWQDIQDHRVRSTATRDSLATLLGSLVRDLTLNVRLLGLGIGLPGPASDAVRLALGTAVPALDQVIGAILGGLGVSIGVTDVRAHGPATTARRWSARGGSRAPIPTP